MAFLIERPIPDRPYFKVGEAAQILGVVPSTVRYWQKEFPDHIKPELSMSGQNVFSRNDVITMAIILNLVRIQGLSIKDARSALTRIIKENGQRIENVALAQQFQLELAAETDVDPDDLTAGQAESSVEESTETPDDGASVATSETARQAPAGSESRYDGNAAEIKALSDEIQALEDENSCLRNQLQARTTEIATLKATISETARIRSELSASVTSVIAEILESLGDYE